MGKKKLLNYDNFEANPQMTTPKMSSPIFEGLAKSLEATRGVTPEFIGDYGGRQGESKYDVGIVPEDIPNLGVIRGQQQPWYEQAGSMLNQAVVGEVVGGTLMSAGALLDLPQMIGNAITGTEEDFHNSIYEAGNKLSNWSREVTPIYQTGDRFSDSGWWFQNGVSVASSASMLLPGMAVAKGVGKLAQLANLSEKASGLLQTGMGALAMRHAENFREANGVFQTIYQDGINKGLDDESAKSNASKAAALDYQANYANLAFDMIELGAILKPTKAFTRNIGGLDFSTAKGIDAVSGMAKKYLPENAVSKGLYWSKENLLPQLSEGVEEVVNQISQYEGERYGKMLNDPTIKDDSTFMGRVGKYLGQADTVDSFLWGVLGGVAFQGIAKGLGLHEGNEVNANKIAEVANRQGVINSYINNIDTAKNRGILTDDSGKTITDFSTATPEDIESFIGAQQDKMKTQLAFNAAKAGNLDILLDQIDDDNFKQQMVNSGLTTEEDYSNFSNSFKNTAKNVEDSYNKAYSRLVDAKVSPEIKNYLLDKTASLEFARNQINTQMEQYNKDYATELGNDPYIKNNLADPKVLNTVDLMSHQIAINELNKQLQTTKDETDKSDIKDTIASLEKDYNNIVANNVGTIDPSLINPSVYRTKAQQIVFGKQFNNFSNDIAKASTPEGIKEATTKKEELKKSVKSNIDSNVNTALTQEKNERMEAARNLIKANEEINAKETSEARAPKQVEETPTPESVAHRIARGAEDFTDEEYNVMGANEDEVNSHLNDIYTNDIPDADYGHFVDTGEVSPEHIENIANKIVAGKRLAPKEEAIHANKTTDVENVIRNKAAYIPENVKHEVEVDDAVKKSLEPTIKSGYTAESEKVVDDAINTINEQYLDYEQIKRLANSHNALARLDREYIISDGKYQEVNNSYHENLFKPILNPNLYGKGTEVTLKVADRNDIQMVDPITGEVTTWGAVKSAHKELDTNSHIPIEVVDNEGNVLGYLHDTTWTNNPDKVLTPTDDTKNMKAIRDYVVSKREVKTTITSKSPGVLNRTTGKKKLPLKDAIQDPNVQIAIAENGIEFRGGVDGKDIMNDLQSNPLNRGFNYIKVQIGNSNTAKPYIALPVDCMTLGELESYNPELFNTIHDSISTAIGLYWKWFNHVPEASWTTAETNLFNASKEAGFLVQTPAGISKYIGAFLYNNPKAPKEGVSQYTFNTEDFRFRRGKAEAGKKLEVYTGVRMNEKSLETFQAMLKDVLRSQYFNSSSEFLESGNIPMVQSDGSITTMNYRDILRNALKTNVLGIEVGEVNGKKAYSYTVQNVVRLDTKFAETPETTPKGRLDLPAYESPIQDIMNVPEYEALEFDPLEMDVTLGDFSLSSTNNENLYNYLIPDTLYQNPKLLHSIYKILGFNIRHTIEKWKEDSEKENKAIYIHLENTPKNQEFQIKTDLEKGYYSVHFKTEQGVLSKENIQILIDAAASFVPIGGKLSTWGTITKGGVSGLNRFLHNGFKKVGERTIKDTFGNSIVIPILEKVHQSNLEQKVQSLYSNYVNNGNSFALSSDKYAELLKATKDLIIKDLGYARQEDVINYIVEKSLSKLADGDTKNFSSVVSEVRDLFIKSKAVKESNVAILRSNLEKAIKANDVASTSKFREGVAALDRAIDLTNAVLTNYSTLVNLTKYRLNNIANIKFKDNAESDTEVENDNFTLEGDENANWGSSDLTVDRKKSLSNEVKRFCSAINDVDINGNPVKTWIGTNRLLSFDEVYNTIQFLTSNLNPNLAEIRQALVDAQDTFPWLSNFVNKLDNASQPTQYAVVKALTNYYSNIQSVKWSMDSAGRTSVAIFNSDTNSIGKAILNLWESNFMSSPLVSYADDNYSLVDANVDKFNSLFEEAKKGKVTKESVDNLFKLAGIELDAKTLDYLEKNGLRLSDKKKVALSAFLTDKFSPLVTLKEYLDSYKGQNVVNKLTANSTFQRLALLQSKFESRIQSNSMRSGGRTVYSFGKPKFFVNRFRRLYNYTTDEGIQKVLASPFVTNMAWAKAIKNDSFREQFLANFDYSIADLNPLSKLGTKDKKNAELNNISPAEIELYKIMMLQAPRADKSGNKNRVIGVLHPTTSDKTTVHQIVTIAADVNFNSDGNINDATYSTLYDNLILPEITRIRHFENLLDAYNKGVSEGTISKDTPSPVEKYAGLDGGWNKFLIIPEMNNLSELRVGETLSPDLENRKTEIIEKVLKPHFNALVNEKRDVWNEYGFGLNETAENGKAVAVNKYMDKSYIKFLANKGIREEFIQTAAINDMIVQSLVANSNTWALFNGDPALYYKSKSKDYIQQSKETFDNMGKRLAADVAPGEESVANDGGSITYGFVSDPKVVSLRYQELLDSFGEDIANAYKGMDGTDAQEFVTVDEHLYGMHTDGLLPEGFYDTVHEAIEKELTNGNHYYTKAVETALEAKDPKFKELYSHLVMQVKKPVYVENIFDEDLGIERRLYVKSSAYPLTPELTAKFEMDDVRVAMEKQGVQRLAFATATKVGNFKKNVSIFESNGDARKIDFTDSKMLVPRSGLRDQMPVPYDEKKKEIKKVSQASKNLFVNIKDVPGMDELEAEYLDSYNKIFRIQHQALLNDVMTDGTLDVEKVKNILKEEATGRGYPLSEVQALDLDKNLRLLPFNANANKYEALLNSIVENRVNKIMLPGKSFVLSTEMGYKAKNPTKMMEGTAEYLETLKSTHGTVFTKNFTGQLLPQRIENGVVKPAQVLMPWKFRDNKGNLLDISKFIDKDGTIDDTKLPEELRGLFGMRIPNQGPNSQSSIEIVGFVPHSMGDVIVATRDYLAQMGSDFDVDKLYSYMYYTKYADGKLSKGTWSDDEIRDLYNKKTNNDPAVDNLLLGIFEDEAESAFSNDYDTFANRFKILELKNRIVDIHREIHANPDPRVQRQIAKPISEWELKDIAKDVTSLQPKSDTVFSPASDAYQKMKFINATAGKVGVGIYSVASMFAANSQGKNLIYTESIEGKRFAKNVTIGDKTWDGDLSNIYTINTQNKLIKALQEKAGISLKDISKKYLELSQVNVFGLLDPKDITYKSEVVEGHQSVAVDNEKLQLMDKTNDNSFTFNFTTAAMAAGFEKELVYLRSQPIIFDYVKELQYLKSPLSGFFGDAEAEAYSKVLSKYGLTDTNKSADSSILTVDNMRKAISKESPYFNDIQGAAIRTFMELKEVGEKIQQLTSATNTDSKGLGITMLANYAKEQAIENLEKSPIVNATSMIGNTISGFSTRYALNTSNSLWSNIFPYRMDNIQELFKTVESITSNEDAGFMSKAMLQQDVWDAFKSYMFSRNDLGIVEEGTDVNSERERLFMDSKDKKGNITKKSFVAEMQDIANIPEMKKRPFISRLEFTINYDGKPSLVKFNAASAENLEEVQIYQDITDLLVNDRPIPGTSYTTRQVMEDLIKTQYLGGGIQEAIQFIKYIPSQYFYSIPFATKLTELWDELEGSNEWLNFSNGVPNFVEQYIQHNPNKARSVEYGKFTTVDGKIVVKEPSLVTKEDGEYSALPYIKTYNANSKLNKTELYKFTNDFVDGNPVYKQIPLLGSFGMSEYNPSLPQGATQHSLVNRIKEVSTTNPTIQQSENTVGVVKNPVVESTVGKMISSIGIDKNSTSWSVMSNLELNTDDAYYQLLANEIGKIKPNVRYEVGNVPGYGIYKNGVVTINPSRMSTSEDVARTLIHETLHAIGNQQIEQFLTDKSKLNPRVREAISSLDTLRSKLVDLMSNEDKARYAEFKTKVSLHKSGKHQSFTNEEVHKFAPLGDLKEFFTYALTDKETQKWLNEIPYSNTQTGLDRFVALLNKIYHAIFGHIKENSALGSAIKDSVVILKSNELYGEVSNTQMPTEEDLKGDIVGSLAMQESPYQVKPFGMFNAKSKVYADNDIWNMDESSPKVFGKTKPVYDRLSNIAQKINESQGVYSAKVATKVVKNREMYYVQLTLKDEMNDLKYRTLEIKRDPKLLDWWLGNCKY